MPFDQVVGRQYFLVQQRPHEESAFRFRFGFPDGHHLELTEGPFKLNAIGAL
jgi:hypothetical protein